MATLTTDVLEMHTRRGVPRTDPSCCFCMGAPMMRADGAASHRLPKVRVFVGWRPITLNAYRSRWKSEPRDERYVSSRTRRLGSIETISTDAHDPGQRGHVRPAVRIGQPQSIFHGLVSKLPARGNRTLSCTGGADGNGQRASETLESICLSLLEYKSKTRSVGIASLRQSDPIRSS
jgi:hypothetical protein